MNFWDQRYSEEGFAYGKEPNDFLKAESSIFKNGGKILFICEGEGRNAIYLAQQGYEITAVDSSSVGMAKTQAWAQSLNLIIETITSDLNDFSFGENKWDGIVSIFGHLPPPLRKLVHNKIILALKPDGIYLSEAYTVEQLKFNSGGPKDESMLLSEEILETELSGLQTVKKIKKEREIREGKYHQGQSAVIQYIGRKKA